MRTCESPVNVAGARGASRKKWSTAARVHFRGLRCPAHQAEAVAETLALCWKCFLRLVERDKGPLTFPSALASYAARHVSAGVTLPGRGAGVGRTTSTFSPEYP
jgi:hypothetical protein